MLARLEEIDGVAAAEADHSGELLRLRVNSVAATEAARAALHDLGYEAAPVEAPLAPDVRWYGRATVRELSREEASVIAAEIAPAFLEETGIAVGTDELRRVVASGLADCFTSHARGPRDLPNTLAGLCASAVAAAASSLLEPHDAKRLGRFVDERLSRYSRSDGAA